ncbi:MAG: VOC family protein [Trueperaceae bacterium]|nr:VOC family protein [Trueperaceae bacterium]
MFDNSRILHVARYGEAGPRPAGSVMTVTFELDGQRFVALGGGPSRAPRSAAGSIAGRSRSHAGGDRLAVARRKSRRGAGS